YHPAMSYDPLVWGTISEWSNALLTAGALAAAIAVGIFASRAYKIQAKQDRVADDIRREQLEMSKRHQAERVVIWLGRKETGDDRTLVVHLLNASDRPIWNASLSATGELFGTVQTHYLELGVLPPMASPREVEMAGDLGYLSNSELTVKLDFRDSGNR